MHRIIFNIQEWIFDKYISIDETGYELHLERQAWEPQEYKKAQAKIARKAFPWKVLCYMTGTMGFLNPRWVGHCYWKASLNRKYRKVHTFIHRLFHRGYTECMTCSTVLCPYGEPLHLHHDGCPSCTYDAEG